MRQQVLSTTFKPRADLRLRMLSHEPVYAVVTVDGGRLDLQVDDLSAGGARLKVRKAHIDLFQVGQILGPTLLALTDLGLPVLQPVVVWKSDSAIGVQFMGVTERQKEMIFKFLFRVERKTVRYLN
jgi:c-di-GMP-binding flagellar brake protein YcgR